MLALFSCVYPFACPLLSRPFAPHHVLVLPLVLPLVLQGLMDPKHLEDLTGLTELHRSCEATLEAWASEDEGEERAAEQGGSGDGGSKQAAAAGEEDWEEL